SRIGKTRLRTREGQRGSGRQRHQSAGRGLTRSPVGSLSKHIDGSDIGQRTSHSESVTKTSTLVATISINGVHHSESSCNTGDQFNDVNQIGERRIVTS